jgi:hypothetical protein
MGGLARSLCIHNCSAVHIMSVYQQYEARQVGVTYLVVGISGIVSSARLYWGLACPAHFDNGS